VMGEGEGGRQPKGKNGHCDRLSHGKPPEG
jgi:hypothetical protein